MRVVLAFTWSLFALMWSPLTPTSRINQDGALGSHLSLRRKLSAAVAASAVDVPFPTLLHLVLATLLLELWPDVCR